MRDIVIKGEHIVHSIYITVIVVLAITLIFKSFGNANCQIENSSKSSGNVENTAQLLKNASVTIIKNTNPKPNSTTITIPKTTTPAKTTTTTQNPNTSQKEEPEEPELLPLTGQIGFTINKVTTEIKGEDWAKVVKIEFTIKNQKPKSFYPRVLAYLWDDNDAADVRDYIEEEIYLNKLEAGMATTEEKDVSISFNEIDKEKTLKLVLYDENDKQLEMAIYKFKVS